MKNFIKDLQKWITIWIWIVLVLWISWISYAVWDWLKAESWDTLEIWKWNELVNKVETLETNLWSWSLLWSNLYSYTTADRLVNTNYTNDTWKSIVVMVTGKDSWNYSYLNMRIDDSLVIRSYLDNDAHWYPNSNWTIVVPNWSTYRVNWASAYLYWHELR